MTRAKKDTTPEKLPATVAMDQLPADLMEQMEEDSQYRQVFDGSMLMIPRIDLLQDLSPEVKRQNPEYVEGAEAGLIFNKVRRTLDSEILFVPSQFFVRYLAWKPRNAGGGLVDQNLTLEECQTNFKPDGIARWVGMINVRSGEEPVRVEVIETPEWVGYAKSEHFDWMPVAISFPSTKAKVAREMNTLIDMTKIPRKNGNGRYTPASFAHVFKLAPIFVPGDNSYYNWKYEWAGYNTDREVIADAKALRLSFEQGRAAVEDPGMADAA